MQNKYNEKEIFSHYIAVEWSKAIVMVARMSDNSSKVIEEKILSPSIKELKAYLAGLKGSKIITIEESTASHWLYVELIDYVKKILICDPYRNSLIKEGPKNDKKDARTLCMLLRSGMLKEVYHNCNSSYLLRRFQSSYEDFVKASVRLQNQRSSVYQSRGKNHKKDKLSKVDEPDIKKDVIQFILSKQEQTIAYLDEKRDEFTEKMHQLSRQYPMINKLKKISGIGTITAFKIYSQVIEASRFENKYKFWSYCGLVNYERESGKRIYGRKKPRFNRILKGAFKMSANSALKGNNDIRQYYEYLLSTGVIEKTAKNQITRYIAKAAYAVMKNNTDYRPYQWREEKKPLKTQTA